MHIPFGIHFKGFYVHRRGTSPYNIFCSYLETSVFNAFTCRIWSAPRQCTTAKFMKKSFLMILHSFTLPNIFTLTSSLIFR